METDFLNFHDEEHFGTALYQSELLDDSQSSLLDIVGDGYHRQDSGEYGDQSVIWEQDVERELNGDVAVIPMSGHINSFPKLSNSPPSKDFQKIFSDWQHLTSIEATPTEDLSADLQLPSQGLVVDMLECFTPSTVQPTITIAKQPTTSKSSLPSTTASSIVSSFDFSNTTVPKVKTDEVKIKKKGGKNLELMKKVTEINLTDDLDSLSDNFDITSYVNGLDDDLLLQNEDKFEKKTPEKKFRKFGGCYEKNMPPEEEKPEIKKEEIEEKKKNLQEDSEEDCIDVETVSEQIPVLEARDLNSLLEQFEASEAVNPKLPQNLFENSLDTKTTSQKQIPNETKQKVKQLNSELKQPTNNKQKTTVSMELLQKIKASTTRKPVSVIPARPSKKIRGVKKVPPLQNETFHFDHDYCSPNTDTNLKKNISPECDNKGDNLIDDTAIRIGKQIKNAINNENALKQKQPIKNTMVSLLKTNNRNKFTGTIINTINTNDEQIQNIIVNNETIERNSKKRKLNLEEYKKLRGDLKKSHSSENSRQSSPGHSGNSSPSPFSDKIEYQELIMKMASDILKTNAKQKQNTCETKLEEFVLPEEKKPAKIQIKQEPGEITPPKIADNYEMKTIVSVGVNTDANLLKSNEKSPRKPDKLREIITPILQNANCKINSNSLITNITATLLQHSPKISPTSPKPEVKQELPEHGEDKTVIFLKKNKEKPSVVSVGVQTDYFESKEKKIRNYRARRDSSESSTASNSSLKSKNSAKKNSGPRQSLRNSSTNSISSSLGSRWSRSRSRSRSRSSSHSEYSSYSSDSSRSKSRSISPRRWHTDRNSRSRHRYNRSRRRSRSNNSYRGNYRHSRSPFSRSRSRRRRERESAERERMREVEERRVIYVGKINDDTTRADLRRRFQSFGPITNVSVHFRDHGDNYGFVTFAYKMDAYEAVERGNEDPNLPKYDISFGGRRAFCKTRYSDLDNTEGETISSAPIFRREEDSFDILLREVQAKLRKRKV